MTKFGLDLFLENTPRELSGKRIGVLCHAASITNRFTHILDEIIKLPQLTLGAIFGPQHGLFGQTQDNMVEWEGGQIHPLYNAPVYSLYGANRKPSPAMLKHIDALVVDLQDVGARPYTYIWTIKLCIEACAELSIPLYILDRPNPIAAIGFDGPLIDPEFFSFVGGAQIPLCHRLTIGEISMLIQKSYHPKATLHVVWMQQWWRNSLWNETRLPWVLPSPNMPTLDTAIVYPGQVLIEATNLSEGRGTTRPFELFGAPYLRLDSFKKYLNAFRLPGCFFREHGFIPTFQKWQGQYCPGMQIHVSQPRLFKPVATSVAIFKGALQNSNNEFAFKPPPYEYETIKMPFDILAGSTELRTQLQSNAGLNTILESWQADHEKFGPVFKAIAHYPEEFSW